MKITYINQACLQFTTNSKKKLVCDPWILDEPVFNFTTWKFPSPVIPIKKIITTDFIYITHSHEDHFHVPSINKFPKNVKVLLPEYESHPHLRSFTIERTLRILGYNNIFKIRPWHEYMLDDKTSLTVIPNAKSRDHDWENTGFVVRDKNFSVLNMNDNLSDNDLCNQIKKKFKKIDLAFIEGGGVTMWPGRFIMSKERQLKEGKKRKLGFDEQKRLINIIKPNFVIPFATDLCWLDEAYFDQNITNRGTPSFFLNSFKKLSPTGTKAEIMYPSDEWDSKKGLNKNHKEIDWENYIDGINIERMKKEKKIKKIRNWIKKSNTKNLLKRLEKRMKITKQAICNDYIDFDGVVKFLVLGKKKFSFYISITQKKGFEFSFKKFKKRNFQTFYIFDYELAAILEGKLTFNTIQWFARIKQHFKIKKIARFWYWFDYHIDLNTKNSQVYLDPSILEKKSHRIRPNSGIFK